MTKNWKTTLIGLLGCVAFLLIAVLLFLKFITAAEAGLLFGAAGTFIASLAALFAKDYDKTGKP